MNDSYITSIEMSLNGSTPVALVSEEEKKTQLVDANKKDIPFLSLNEMDYLIREKERRRKQNLNIFIVPITEKKHNNGLKIFFKLLAENIAKDIPVHFQLAVKDGGHWFAIDCYVKEKLLYLLVIDPAQCRDINVLLNLFYASFCPEKVFFYIYKGIKIQQDGRHCAFFALDILFRLSNHHNHWNDLLIESLEKNILYFNEQECPDSLAFIFKNIQSLTEFKKLPDNLKKTVINKKSMNLEDKIEKYTLIVNVNNQSVDRNLGIVSKRIKYLRSLKNLLNKEEFSLITRSFEVIGGVEWAATLIPYLSSLIENELDFQTILQYLTPRYCEEVCERLENKICSIIQNPSDITALTNLMPEQRTAVYEVIKTPLHSVIKDSIAFIKCVFSVSPPEQRATINKMLKKQFPTIIKNVADFDNDSFSDLNHLIIYEAVAEKVGSSLVAFNKFLKNLETFEQCTIVCKALKKKLFTLIKYPDDFQTILYALTEQPLALSEAICGVFKEQLFSLITKPFNLGTILRDLTKEQCLMIFKMVKAESSLIIETPLDFGNALQCFIPEYSTIVIELISEQLSKRIQSPTDLNAYLSFVTNSEQCRVLCKLIKEKPLFIKNISDLQNILHELAGELHTEIFKEFKEQLPSFIQCTSDLHIILESSPKPCYTIVLEALKEKLSSIKVKNASDFKKLFKSLDLKKQRTDIFNSFKTQLYSIIKSVSDLNDILIHLSPEECRIVCEMVKEGLIAIPEDDMFLSRLLIYLNKEQCDVICAVLKEKILSSKNSSSFQKNLKLLDPDQRVKVNTVILEINAQLEDETQNLNTITGSRTMGIFPDKNNYHNTKSTDHALPSYLVKKILS